MNKFSIQQGGIWWNWESRSDCWLLLNINLDETDDKKEKKRKKKKEKRRKWDENERHINNHWYIYIKVEGGRWRSRLNEENGELRSGHTYWSTPFPLLCLKNLLGFVLDSRKIIMFRWHFRNFGLGPTPLLMEWIFVLFYIFMEWIFALF